MHLGTHMIKKILLFTLFIILFFIGCAREGTGVGLGLDPPMLVAPVDGATITQNPPTFIWQSVENTEIVYILEVATDEQFDYSSIVISTMIVPSDTNYTPDNSFASGEYYWHMCIREDC